MAKLLFILIFSMAASQACGETTADSLKKDLSTMSISSPLINEMVAIDPITDHHFNLEAPQNCGEKASIDKNARKIICQFHDSGTHKVTVSVCDNQKR
ncbi:MAG: hypothetical protein AAF203_04780, partial [Pseudomonadota bacterium]